VSTTGRPEGDLRPQAEGSPVVPPAFAPTRAEALARAAAIDPEAYARTRNHLEGAVSRLSPYLTHGLVTLPEVLAEVLRRHPRLPAQAKLVFEFGWREYFHHAWRHHGAALLERSLRAGPLPVEAYAAAVPADVLEARTGLPPIDLAVRALHRGGWLHNHARMWLASHLVHGRKVHWRAGAEWMFAHLLDGDLASNHGSWQWVAGTGSGKPYLFNAENVARHAPPPWHARGTAIDTGYEALDAVARHAGGSLPPEPGAARLAAEPVPPCFATPPAGSFAIAPMPPSAAAVTGRRVRLLHPWCLRATPDDTAGGGEGTLRVGVLVQELHAARPWSAARWGFVGAAMSPLVDRVWLAPAAAIGAALDAAAEVRGVADPHLQGHLASHAREPVPHLFAEPARRCDSFSKWWTLVSGGHRFAAELPGLR
jgi:deoxyribodipyrimidine photo-lyase